MNNTEWKATSSNSIYFISHSIVWLLFLDCLILRVLDIQLHHQPSLKIKCYGAIYFLDLPFQVIHFVVSFSSSRRLGGGHQKVSRYLITEMYSISKSSLLLLLDSKLDMVDISRGWVGKLGRFFGHIPERERWTKVVVFPKDGGCEGEIYLNTP